MGVTKSWTWLKWCSMHPHDGKTRVWDKNTGGGRNGVEEGVWSEFRALRFDISMIGLYWFVKLSWVKLWTQVAMRSGDKWYEWNRRLQKRGGQGNKRIMVQWAITWLFTSWFGGKYGDGKKIENHCQSVWMLWNTRRFRQRRWGE